MRKQLIAGLALLAALAGCQSDYETLRVRRLAGAEEAEASGQGFIVPEGRIVAFTAKAISRDTAEEYDVTDVLELRSVDSRIARVVPGVRVDTWAITAGSVGQTEIEVFVNGDFQEAIPVVVDRQAVEEGQ